MSSVRKSMARGFTLVELMIVVVVISILATVAVASFKKFKSSARKNEGVAAINDIRIKQETFFNTYSRYLSSTSDEESFDGILLETADLRGYYEWDVDCPDPGVAWCDLGFDPPRHEIDGNSSYTHFQFQTIGWSPGAAAPSYVSNSNERWLAIRARGLPDESAQHCVVLVLTNSLSEIGETQGACQ
jgi:prepilin-type N-terminal cleavage/methylation domain-containing protein